MLEKGINDTRAAVVYVGGEESTTQELLL
jgi:hypothetical protein